MKLDQLPGLNTANTLHEVGFTGFVQAENIDLSRGGSASRRAGRTRVYTGNISAAWGDGEDFLFVENGTLKRLNADYSATVLREGLTTPDILYVLRSVTGQLYWSTGHDYGIIISGVDHAWGIPKPSSPQIQQALVGELSVGRYMVAAAYVNEQGTEGPLSNSVIFEGEYGITIEAFALSDELTLAQVESVNIYLTSPNGEVLYLALNMGLGIDGSYREDASELAIPADGLYREVMPIGRWIVDYAGRLWTALDNILVYSDPYSEMTDLRENFIPFGERITNFGAVSDGLVVTTVDRVYFLGGQDPNDMRADEKAKYGAIENTMVQVDGRVIGEGQNTRALIWTSSKGVCIGLPGGTVANLTERQVNDLPGSKGAAFLREVSGQRHYITVLQGT